MNSFKGIDHFDQTGEDTLLTLENAAGRELGDGIHQPRFNASLTSVGG